MVALRMISRFTKDLSRGDPLSPFLLLIVAESLAGLVDKAVQLGEFTGFEVNTDLSFSLLQCADDTILMGKGYWENLWSIKTIFRSLELVSGLKVNFHKSNLYGLNVKGRVS